MIAANKLKAKAAGAKVVYGYLDTGDSAGDGWTIKSLLIGCSFRI